MANNYTVNARINENITAGLAQIEKSLGTLERRVKAAATGKKAIAGIQESDVKNLNAELQRVQLNIQNIKSTIASGLPVKGSKLSGLTESLIKLDVGARGARKRRLPGAAKIPGAIQESAELQAFSKEANKPTLAPRVSASASAVEQIAIENARLQAMRDINTTALNTAKIVAKNDADKAKALAREEEVVNRINVKRREFAAKSTISGQRLPSDLKREANLVRVLAQEREKGNRFVTQSASSLRLEANALDVSAAAMSNAAKTAARNDSAKARALAREEEIVNRINIKRREFAAKAALAGQQSPGDLQREANLLRTLAQEREMGNRFVTQSASALRLEANALDTSAAALREQTAALKQQQRAANRTFGVGAQERSRNAQLGLQGIGSAAQGALGAMSALDGNIMGVAFSFIFLQFSMVPIAAAFAALTLLVAPLVKQFLAARDATEQISKMGATLRATGRTAVITAQAMNGARQLFEEFGFDAADAAQGVGQLIGAGFDLTAQMEDGTTILSLIGKIAAASGRSFEDVAGSIISLIKPNDILIGGFDEFRSNLDALIPALIRSENGAIDLLIADAQLFGETAGLIDAQKRLNQVLQFAADNWSELAIVGKILIDKEGELTDAGQDLLDSLVGGSQALGELALAFIEMGLSIDDASEAVRIFFTTLGKTQDLFAAKDAVRDFLELRGITDPERINKIASDVVDTAEKISPAFAEAEKAWEQLVARLGPGVPFKFDPKLARETLDLLQTETLDREFLANILATLETDKAVDTLIRAVQSGGISVSMFVDAMVGLDTNAGLAEVLRDDERLERLLTLDFILTPEAKALVDRISNLEMELGLKVPPDIDPTPVLGPIDIRDQLGNRNFFQRLGDKGLGFLKKFIESVGSIGNVQGFAHGGIVKKPTMGLVGEAGPEAIIPLEALLGQRRATPEEIEQLRILRELLIRGPQVNMAGFDSIVDMQNAAIVVADDGTTRMIINANTLSADQQAMLQELSAEELAAQVATQAEIAGMSANVVGAITDVRDLMREFSQIPSAVSGKAAAKGSMEDVLGRALADIEDTQDKIDYVKFFREVVEKRLPREEFDRLKEIADKRTDREIEEDRLARRREGRRHDRSIDDFANSAKGNVFTSPSVTAIAENSPEVVLPLVRGTGGVLGVGTGNTTIHVTVHVDGNVIGNREFLDDIAREIVRSTNVSMTGRM